MTTPSVVKDESPDDSTTGPSADGEPTRPAGIHARTPISDAPPADPAVPNRRLGYRRQRFEARKVRRLIRHIDPWSVLKLSILLGLCMWVIGLIAAVIIWSVANNTGALDSLQKFVNEMTNRTDFEMTGSVLFRQFGLISLLGVLGFAAACVVGTLVFNLISDIIGGVWVSVIEEETARPIVDARSQAD